MNRLNMQYIQETMQLQNLKRNSGYPVSTIIHNLQQTKKRKTMSMSMSIAHADAHADAEVEVEVDAATARRVSSEREYQYQQPLSRRSRSCRFHNTVTVQEIAGHQTYSASERDAAWYTPQDYGRFKLAVYNLLHRFSQMYGDQAKPHPKITFKSTGFNNSDMFPKSPSKKQAPVIDLTEGTDMDVPEFPRARAVTKQLRSCMAKSKRDTNNNNYNTKRKCSSSNSSILKQNQQQLYQKQYEDDFVHWQRMKSHLPQKLVRYYQVCPEPKPAVALSTGVSKPLQQAQAKRQKLTPMALENIRSMSTLTSQDLKQLPPKLVSNPGAFAFDANYRFDMKQQQQQQQIMNQQMKQQQQQLMNQQIKQQQQQPCFYHMDAASLNSNGNVFVTKPGPYDIVCGRNSGAYNSTGNVRFRVTIEANLNRYTKTRTKEEKTDVIKSIVMMLQTRVGARFLKKETVRRKDGLPRYTVMNDKQAREKVGHAIRDLVLTVTRKSKEDPQAQTQAEPQAQNEQAQAQAQNEQGEQKKIGSEDTTERSARTSTTSASTSTSSAVRLHNVNSVPSHDVLDSAEYWIERSQSARNQLAQLQSSISMQNSSSFMLI